MSGRTILWHSFGDRDDDRFVQASFEEMLNLISRAVPAANLSIDRLRPREHPNLLSLVESGDLDAALRAVMAAGRGGGFGLFVYCLPAHPAARASRGRHPLAVWGLNLRGALCVTYGRDNKFILWHEALHLLGVDDHYDERTLRTTCGLPTCLMQYAPSHETMRNRRPLCARVTAALQKSCGGQVGGHWRLAHE